MARKANLVVSISPTRRFGVVVALQTGHIGRFGSASSVAAWCNKLRKRVPGGACSRHGKLQASQLCVYCVGSAW